MNVAKSAQAIAPQLKQSQNKDIHDIVLKILFKLAEDSEFDVNFFAKQAISAVSLNK